MAACKQLFRAVCLGFAVALFFVVFKRVLEDDKGCFTSILPSNEIVRTQYGLQKADDPALLRNIRQRWLVGPSDISVNLTTNGTDRSQVGQSKYVDTLLGRKRNGFFVECGALDGESYSNTLFLELERHWTGLLVEANSHEFKNLLQKNRKVYSINACLSVANVSETRRFSLGGVLGGLVGTMDRPHLKAMGQRPEQTVQCFTLYSLLLAVGINHVDYFSLDIEGAELEVLETFPFDKIRIEVISVEYRSSDMITIHKDNSLAKLNKIRDFFRKTGMYEEKGILPKQVTEAETDALGLDVFFQRI